MNLFPQILLAGMFTISALARDAVSFPTSAPACVELLDQFDTPQKLSFPTTNVTILTIADRKGSEEVDGWIDALKSYLDRVDIRGLANIAGAPGFLQGKIRKKFQESRRYPVMMDWTGKTCALFAFRAGVANILVLGPDGKILARFHGVATAAGIKDARAVVERALTAKKTADG